MQRDVIRPVRSTENRPLSVNEDQPDSPELRKANTQEPVGSGKKKAAVAFILLTIFIDILGIGIIIPNLPELIVELLGPGWEDLSKTELTALASWYGGIIAASYALMQFIFAPVVGALSDCFGRRPVLLAATFGLAVDYTIQGFAPNLTWLFIGRILAGLFGASITTANAYIADVSLPENRARNYGLVGIMFGLGFICGPSLGGVLGSFDLRLPFFASAGLALLNWLYGLFILPESLPREKRRPFSLAHATPLGTLKKLRDYPMVFQLAAAFACMSLAQRGLENVWVYYTGFRFGWDNFTNGLALGLVGLMAAIVQGGLVRPVVARLGERKTVLLGLSISAVAFLGYGLAPAGWVIPIIITFGSLGGLTGPAIQSLVAGSVDSSEQGKIQGALTSLMSLTSIVSPLLFTAGLFSFFTQPDRNKTFLGWEFTIPSIPGIPFFIGSALLVTAMLICRRIFIRFPKQGSSAIPDAAECATD